MSRLNKTMVNGFVSVGGSAATADSELLMSSSSWIGYIRADRYSGEPTVYRCRIIFLIFVEALAHFGNK